MAVRTRERDPATLNAVLRPLVRNPAAWFACALQLALLVPSIGEDLDRALDDRATRSGEEAVDSPERLFALARAFALLAGHAAENYLKGLWIASRKESDGGAAAEAFLPGRVTRNDLTAIARGAGVPLTDEERSTLEFLEEGLAWWAKYPVPSDAVGARLVRAESDTIRRTRDLLGRLDALARESAEKESPG